MYDFIIFRNEFPKFVNIPLDSTMKIIQSILTVNEKSIVSMKPWTQRCYTLQIFSVGASTWNCIQKIAGLNISS